uniref:Ubiquitin-like protease family profile domain-containing protein n=1 Tax=Trichobilharzia regenti TaxID=157069 RepID=A0AA85JDG1_TRIRE|nr:unnamed protein product [Trichobilharzia regenti]
MSRKVQERNRKKSRCLNNKSNRVFGKCSELRRADTASTEPSIINRINTLTNDDFQLKMNSDSATQESNVNCRGKSETNEECDELIIIHEENTSNVAAQPPSDNVQAESTTNCDEDSFKFDYKPAGSVDGITLTKSDLQCLEPGALINDAIINFYLKYLYFEQLTDSQRQATHVFNVFFYSRLTSGNVSVDTHNSTVTETTTE